VDKLPSLARSSSEISPPADGPVAMARRAVEDAEIPAVARRNVEESMMDVDVNNYYMCGMEWDGMGWAYLSFLCNIC
jgi:hypothetical protein